MNVVEKFDDALYAIGSRVAFGWSSDEQRRQDLRKKIRSSNSLVFALWEPASLLFWFLSMCVKLVGAALMLWFVSVMVSVPAGFGLSIESVAVVLSAYASSPNAVAAIASDLRASMGFVGGGVLVVALVAPGLVFNWRRPVDRYMDRYLLAVSAEKRDAE